MIKFKLYVDKDKEIIWLNEMAEKGYNLTKFVAGFYHFVEGEPGKYEYQIDISKGMFSVSEDYRHFMYEQGIEIVSLWGPWIILRRVKSKEKFELFSDNESLIENYTKIRNMFKIVTVIEIVCLALETVAAIMTGKLYFYIFMAILGFMVLVFMRITFRTNEIIARLKNEEGIVYKRKVSKVLASAMLLNFVALLLRESVSDMMFRGMYVFVLVLMAIGIFRTVRNRNTSSY